MVLVGPSGCGKSTTLRMIAGLERVTGGTISIGGRVVNNLEPKERGIAMVFQSYALYPHMTISKNMAFGLQLAKKTKEFIADTVGRTAKALQLDHMMERKPAGSFGWSAAACRSWARHCAESQSIPFRRTTVQPGCQNARSDALGDLTVARSAG